MTRFALSLALALVLTAPLWADETESVAAAPASNETPQLALEHLDLLPLGEFERDDLVAAHPEVVRRVQSLAGRIARLEGELATFEKKKGVKKEAVKRKVRKQRAKADRGGKLRAEISSLRTAAAEPLAALTEILRAHGLTDAMIDLMARAPTGRARIERYAHQLVLLLDDLDPTQRAIFERVIPEVDGAYLAAQALRDRTELTLKQSGLEPRRMKSVLSAFERQTKVIESRFWRLVDYVLADGQKAELWSLLPRRIRRHASPEDHVYTLPGLSPAQAARVKALATEVEAESAPDQALVNRIRKALSKKDLPPAQREALKKEQGEAYGRLRALRRYAHDAATEILTPAQIRLFEAIPPRVSANDRRRSGSQILAGMTFNAAQKAALAAVRDESGHVAKAYRARMKEAREEAIEVGPDSPQQITMQMMMMSARGDAQTAQRLRYGRVFREVLTPEQLSGWVMGLYGDRR